MDKKLLIKYVSYVVVAGLCTVAVFVFLNSLSCVSMPKFIEGEPMQCAEAKQMAYLAAATPKEKITEGIVTESVRACNAMLRYAECKKDRQNYLDSNPETADRYLELIRRNNADAIMNTCLLNLKP